MKKPQFIEIPTPPLGGKIWLLESKGLFVLQKSPGMLCTIACTHAGSGSLVAYDGIPNDDGFFPDEQMPIDHPKFNYRNGRPIYRANPAIMGSWMTSGGFFHGLTIHAGGGVESAAAIASIVWMAVKAKAPDAKSQ